MTRCYNMDRSEHSFTQLIPDQIREILGNKHSSTRYSIQMEI